MHRGCAALDFDFKLLVGAVGRVGFLARMKVEASMVPGHTPENARHMYKIGAQRRAEKPYRALLFVLYINPVVGLPKVIARGRNARVGEIVVEKCNRRKERPGLSLGCCNGFQFEFLGKMRAKSFDEPRRSPHRGASV